jgi:hypothetical protein
MYWLVALTFIGLPLGFAVFFCWRAYQLAIVGRVELSHQWLPKAPGIERYAKLFAVRDLIFAAGCFLFLALILTVPHYFAAWTSLLAVFGLVHQAISAYAVQKVRKGGQG